MLKKGLEFRRQISFSPDILRSSRLLCCFLFALFIKSADSASLNLSGNYRFGASMYSNLDLDPGKPVDTGNTSSYLEHRFFLRPDVVVDEHFTIKSNLSFLQLSDYPASSTTTPPRFGTPLDSSASQRAGSQLLEVRNLYLNWNHDFGVFKFGRMPKHWGLGLIYDSGSEPSADYGSTVDAINFQSLVGSLILSAAYEKNEESHLNSDHDDVETYSGSVEYLNQDDRFNSGILYERTIRAAASVAHQVNKHNSSHNLSFYFKKEWDHFSFGSELATISYNKEPDVVGVLQKAKYKPSSFFISEEFAYSTKNGANSFLFNNNYQPLLLMYRQNMGAFLNPRQARKGGPVGAAIAKGDGAGSYLGALGFGYAFSQDKHILDTKIAYAMLEEKATNPTKSLGVEWDVNFLQSWYDNFKTSYQFGILFPGNAFGTDIRPGWGVQLRGYLVF